MRSYAAIAGEPVDPDVLRAVAAALRLPSSSAPETHLERGAAFACVSHATEDANLIVSRDGVTVTGEILLEEQRKDDHAFVAAAWTRWGSALAERLHGEFSFAAWDARAHELVAVRDRFGVRPLYYARIGRGVIVSDSLAAVLAHPAVGAGDLDAAAITDYLAIANYGDASATVFSNIRRVPPAHRLSFRDGVLDVRRYWSAQEPRQLIAPAEAPQRLADAIRRAVADRVRGDRALMFMSGGLDSTSIAALARESLPHVALAAGTSVYRHRIRDDEEQFATDAARSIGIPIHLFVLDDHPVLGSIDEGLWTPEPGPLLTAAMTKAIYTFSAEQAPVALHGHPADALLSAEVGPYVNRVASTSGALAAARALAQYVRIRRRPPWFVLRGLGRRPTGLRSGTIDTLLSPYWSSLFEWAHPLMTGAAIQLSYPFADARVVEAALALPPIPSLVDKHVLRELLRGRVSESVRTRRKSIVQGDPFRVRVATRDLLQIRHAAQYVDAGRFAETTRDGVLSESSLRAVLLEYWLRELPGRVRQLRVAPR